VKASLVSWFLSFVESKGECIDFAFCSYGVVVAQVTSPKE
jgi:hypothetical protein